MLESPNMASICMWGFFGGGCSALYWKGYLGVLGALEVQAKLTQAVIRSGTTAQE